jgi:hypothetical protein
MLELPNVTLLCVDTRLPALAIAAMQRCQAQVRFADAVLLTDPTLVAHAPAGIRLHPVCVDSVAAYSSLVLRGLLPHVATSHVLVVQWDGFVLDAAQWDPAFLEFDYIGALLRGEPPERSVGNGGFSLRSRKLLTALLDPQIRMSHPEDLCICHENRERLERQHAVRIAPVDVAARFSYERIVPGHATFGFHGLFNLHRVLAPAQLHELVRSLPDQLARGLDARDLCRALIVRGQLDTAAELLAKRRRLGMRDRRTLQLRCQYQLAWWRRQRQSEA